VWDASVGSPESEKRDSHRRRKRGETLGWAGEKPTLRVGMRQVGSVCLSPIAHGTLRWTPDFGRPDKVNLPGWEAPY